MVDRTTRWPEVGLLKGVGAEEVLDVFITCWVARYGLPTCITTDRGRQFSSATWDLWCSKKGVKHVQTTAYHPQSNGMVERWHRQLKDALRAREAAEKWEEHLPWVMLGLRATPKDESGISAGEAALGHQLSVPGQLLPPTDHVRESVPPPTSIPASKRPYSDVVKTSSMLDNVNWVYVRRGGVGKPLDSEYHGPYRVLERGNKVFKVEMGERVDTVSRDRLRPHRGTSPERAAQPPRRGRPPGTGGGSVDVLPP